MNPDPTLRKLIVAGPRNYKDRTALYTALEKWCEENGGPPDELVHGGANGADKMGGDWANYKGVRVRVFKADWSSLGPSAGPARNRRWQSTVLTYLQSTMVRQVPQV